MPSRLFPLIRPAYEDELELASTEARNNAELSAALERQTTFDNEVVDQVRALGLSDQQTQKLESSLATDSAPSQTLIASPESLASTSVHSSVAPLSPPTPPANSPEVPPLVVPAPASTQVPGAIGAAASNQPVPEPHSPHQDLPTAKDKEDQEEEEEEPRARPLTIFFAIGVGLIATICLVGYIVWDQMNSFQGTDRIADLLNSANGLTGDEFEAVQTNTDALKDWFLLKNEHFAVPKEFGPTRTIACRVFQFHNADVGQVMAKDNRELLYFLFDPTDLSVKLKPGKWEIVEAERLVGGITLVEGTCFIVAFRGKREDMQSYLAKKVPGIATQ